MKQFDESFLQKLVTGEIAGKNGAIHAYDKIMWTVRSGFLTLVFAGWGIMIKAAIEKGAAPYEIRPYIYTLAGFTLVLAIAGFIIDRNYARRKFRIITTLNQLTERLVLFDIGDSYGAARKELIPLLQVSGDAANKNYVSRSYRNEIIVSCIIFISPSILTLIVSLFIL